MNIIDNAYRRYSTERFRLPSDAQLTELESQINGTLPDDYRQFILQFNGGYFREPTIEPVSEGCPADALTYLHGIGAPHWSAELGYPTTLSLFEDNDPPQILPIGGTAMGGLVVMFVTGDEIGWISLKEAYGDIYFLADGIEEFFSLLREPESSGE